jgi:hypothetical protein
MTNNTSIKFCTIHNNKVGVDIAEGSDNSVSYNEIYDNDDYQIRYDNTSGLGPLTAEYNWFGTIYGPTNVSWARYATGATYNEAGNYIQGTNLSVNTTAYFNVSYVYIPLSFQINNTLNTSATSFNVDYETGAIYVSNATPASNDWITVNAYIAGIYWINVTNAENSSEFVNFTVEFHPAIYKYIDYIPWSRAGIGNWNVTNVTATGINTIDTIADTNAKVEVNATAIPIRVSTAQFAGNPGTGFVININRFVDVHVNNTAAIDFVNVSIYYTEDDMYGKRESSTKVYFWNLTSNRWEACENVSLNAADVTVSGVKYSGYATCSINATSKPSTSDLSGTAFGLGAYSDPVGGIALSVDKLSLIAHLIIAALAILIPILRNLNR